MFGFFKKPTARKTLERSAKMWGRLSERDRTNSAKNVLIYVDMIYAECQSRQEFFLKISKIRMGTISEFEVKTEDHPLIMQIDIISDYLFCFWTDEANFLEAKRLMDGVVGFVEEGARAHLCEKLEVLKKLP